MKVKREHKQRLGGGRRGEDGQDRGGGVTLSEFQLLKVADSEQGILSNCAEISRGMKDILERTLVPPTSSPVSLRLSALGWSFQCLSFLVAVTKHQANTS